MGKYSYNSQTEDNLLGNLERNLVFFLYFVYSFSKPSVHCLVCKNIHLAKIIHLAEPEQPSFKGQYSDCLSQKFDSDYR